MPYPTTGSTCDALQALMHCTHELRNSSLGWLYLSSVMCLVHLCTSSIDVPRMSLSGLSCAPLLRIPQ